MMCRLERILHEEATASNGRSGLIVNCKGYAHLKKGEDAQYRDGDRLSGFWMCNLLDREPLDSPSWKFTIF